MRNTRPSAGRKIPGELALIDRIRKRAGTSSPIGLTLGIGDDCALLCPKSGEETAITTDLSIEGRHFRLDSHPPEAIGHRALARGLSDLAAMGARPVACFLSLGLPPKLAQSTSAKAPAWVDRFFDGFLRLAELHQTPLAGGDLAQSPIAIADIVLIGAVPRGEALLRSRARPGDSIYVTGSLGGSALGLRRLNSVNARSPDLVPHLWPQPRITQALWLRKRNAASAAIDISDGLSTDLRHICEESRVSAEVDASLLPIFPGAELEDALHGGEDYELLFTASPGTRIPRSVGSVRVTCIGVIVRNQAGGARVALIDKEGRRHALEPGGWEHFRTAKPE